MSAHSTWSCQVKLGFVHIAIYSELHHAVSGLEVSDNSVLATACYLFTETTCETLETTRTMSGYIYIYIFFLSRG